MGIEIGGGIERINGTELTYDAFAETFLAKNLPVVLTHLTDDWRARRDWVDENGCPNLQFFVTHFGKSKVHVADCDTREFTDQKRVEMSVAEFVEHWIEDSTEGKLKDASYCGKAKSNLYLKDWHFVKEYPQYIAYRTPPLFGDDWLNIYLDSYHMHEDRDTFQKYDQISCSDYRFVYMGAKGSWTPLHADVFRSYSWSANVCGRKRWLFLPPSQSHYVFDRYMKNCVYDIFEDVDDTKFPGFKKTTWLECIQEPGEIIFVPSGWYHQVYNLEDTISINHNWFNAYNLSRVWDLLWKDYKDTEESIEDIRDICDDFEAICQRNLAANTGMNFIDFFMFMSRFCLGNVVLLHTCCEESKPENASSSAMAKNLASNLSGIREIMLTMKSVDGLAVNRVYLDLKATMEDPHFLKFCRDMGRTYTMIHNDDDEEEVLYWEEVSLVTGLTDYKTEICSPEDVVDMIDRARSCLCLHECQKKIVTVRV
ncbi:PREDICTED: jmjC domain-containing protein 4 [Tarenaya hassleriana]|uniref:jmjC domain-containing protein 4 n=1 Tax=Tarenaya hassleriana TaxID=28532 RepID=UPI00053C481F|nr:PREDICTED: jmjC domain-containing protein 4 [Tarenaya hassleriana]